MASSWAEQVTNAIRFVFASYGLPKERHIGFDRDIRHPEWTGRALDALGRPDRHGYNIAVTGSKGKGSHAILTAAILERLGYRVGLFTSPHLVDFLERIRLNGEMIPESEFVRVAATVRQVVDKLPIPPDEYIGPVGVVAVMAALWFMEQQTDFNLFELGRGARHDDVNQIVHHGAIITPVFPEHLDRLGPTWEDVVTAKMGILTDDVSWVAVSEQAPRAMAAMRPYLARVRNLAYSGEAFRVDVVPVERSGMYLVRAWHQDKVHSAHIDEGLLPYPDNVGLALVAAAQAIADESRGQRDLQAQSPINVDLRDLILPGRLHVVRESPTVVVDGAIHAVNAAFVRRFVERRQAERPGRVVAVLSLPDDKDADGVVSTLAPVVDGFIFTTASNPHLQYTRDLARHTRDQGLTAVSVPDVERAIERAISSVGGNDLVLCVGTQSFVGDTLRFFHVATGSIWRSRMGDETH
ncbi:dihydrofolate synthase [Alicyclobacillus sacchari]|uniref:glutamate ligase domain-containing protein n=1 Tax=Alicyclobacillus sacchari TaxID=392010 RepID=UPI0023E9AAEB|nr:bifunctional folylpolyglutamate synthase/dihydrofolate synthase [Alicyclobacillus sacchari]GMA56429.1 dihydrofolate synthase [Alicyclobacillus sacchari]